MIGETHLIFEGGKYIFLVLLLLLGTCIGNNVFWVCVQ